MPSDTAQPDGCPLSQAVSGKYTESRNEDLADELIAIIDFVEGSTQAKQFESILYRQTDQFEHLLDNDPYRFTDGQGLFFFLISQDYSNPEQVLSVQEALMQYLKRNDIPFQATNRHQQLTEVIRASQPEWSALDPAYLQREILLGSEAHTKETLEQWLRRRLMELFRYVHQPPNWIQSPEWPIGENGPLLFIGQLDSGDRLRHGETFYVFYDIANGTTETVVQVQC